MTSNKDIKFKLVISYVFLLLGALLEIGALQIIGCIMIFFFIANASIEKALLYIMAMVPNCAIFTISSIGSNFLGFSFLIILFKIIIGRNGWRLYIPPYTIIVSVYLLFISIMRVTSSNFYDFALVCQIIIVVIAWNSIIRRISYFSAIGLIDIFRFGCILMTLGMIFQYPFEKNGIGRFHAVLDDCNYTGGVCCILLCMGLIIYCYKLPIKNNYKYITLAIMSGLMTGSRGFLLSSAVGFFVLLITHSFGKQTFKFVLSVLMLFAISYSLYLLNFGPAITVFDNTIGRTMTLEEAHSDGQFMDVTSGRTILWGYYMALTLKDMSIFYFGKGFYNYFKEENGGFGLAAHNMYVSSIVGVGIIGTILILLLYFSIIKNHIKGIHRKYIVSFGSIVAAIMVCYFFLDGILETRFVSYFAIMILLIKIWSYNESRIDI